MARVRVDVYPVEFLEFLSVSQVHRHAAAHEVEFILSRGRDGDNTDERTCSMKTDSLTQCVCAWAVH